MIRSVSAEDHEGHIVAGPHPLAMEEHVGEHAAVANPQAQAQAQSRSQARSQSQSLRLVPVEITEAACPLLGGAAAALVIEISGARIVVGGGSIDRPALTAVLDCLRESGAQ